MLEARTLHQEADFDLDLIGAFTSEDRSVPNYPDAPSTSTGVRTEFYVDILWQRGAYCAGLSNS